MLCDVMDTALTYLPVHAENAMPARAGVPKRRTSTHVKLEEACCKVPRLHGLKMTLGVFAGCSSRTGNLAQSAWHILALLQN